MRDAKLLPASIFNDLGSATRDGCECNWPFYVDILGQKGNVVGLPVLWRHPRGFGRAQGLGKLLVVVGPARGGF